ncbi:MAG: dihydrofolate reductase family protein [Actinomycetia bacterium]|jgi:riboflavin biosynthesis pyrimidine reductase|nr:dihydrofolate reductase family protein [Actinomycetes bacterium]
MRRLLPDPADEVDLADAYAYPAGRARWLRANMVASADGAATAADGLSGTLSSPADRRVFHLLRDLADVVVVGAGTVRAEGYRPARLPIAVVSGRLDLDLSAPLLAGTGPRTVVLTTAAVPAERLAAARAVADVVVCGVDRVDPALAVAALAERGHRRLLCEGGPRLLGQLAAAGLLDELCLTIAPLLASGEGPRALAGPPLLPPVPLRLDHLLEEDGALFARYVVRRD